MTTVSFAEDVPTDRAQAFAEWVVVASRPTKFLSASRGRLERLGLATKEAIPLFASAIDDKEAKVRRAASLALWIVGKKDPTTAVPALIRAIRDEDRNVRANALNALESIGPAAEASVPALVGLLRDDEESRGAVADALSEIGEKAALAVGELTAALADKSASTRRSAAHALGSIGQPSSAATGDLRVRWQDPNPDVRLAAARAVWRIDQSEDAVAVLTALIETGDSDCELAAVEALGEIGPPAKDAIPALQRIKSGQDKVLLAPAIWAIGKIQKSENLIEQLTPTLRSKEPRERIGAVWSISKMGRDAHTLLPVLVEIRDDHDEDGFLRSFAAEVIEELEKQSP